MTLRVFAGALCALGVGLLVVTIAGRVASPWPLEWMEGASLAHALRILHGQPLYAAPSAEFIPFVYPPLSYLPMALSVALFGPQLWAARLPSVIALACALVAVARAARRAQGSLEAGLVAAGFFALGYGYGGGFFDLARVDALFIALIACGAERLGAERPRQGLACLALACFAKQHALLLLAAASCGLLLRRRELPAVLAAWGAVALGYGWLDLASGGWFWTYCLRVPARHGLEPRLLVSYLLVDLLLYLPGLCLLAGAALWRRRSQLPLVAAAVLASALGRAHPGGDDNVRLPAFTLLVLVTAPALCELYLVSRARWQRALLLAGAGLQALMLVQAPSLYWLQPSAAEHFARLRAELRRCGEGGVSVALDHTLLTGAPFVHTLALSDLRMNRDLIAQQASEALLRALRSAQGPRALAVSRAFPALARALERDYALCSELDGFALPTGYAIGPTRVYRRLTACCGDSARSASPAD